MNSLIEELRRQYQSGQNDYWMPPIVVKTQDPTQGRVKPDDTVIFCCRRGEREVQLTETFVETEFPHFPRHELNGLRFVPMVRYHEKFADVATAFPPVKPENGLSSVLSGCGKRMMSISESEKEAHVTYFFNGRRGDLFEGQQARIIPSWQDFANHPEMRSREIGAAICEALPEHDFVLANFAAGDVIGHLFDFDLKVRCVETIDETLGTTLEAARNHGYTVLITADHGLIERGRNSDGTPSVAHTTAQVRFIVVDESVKNSSGTVMSENGSLADIAPTVLSMMKLPVPSEMTGTPITTLPRTTEKVLLLILDGWGIGDTDLYVNPIAAASTPVIDGLLEQYPHTAIEASGVHVGLPEGRGGNSETGHLTMGAGRVIEQDELRLRKAMEEGFRNNEVITEAVDATARRGGALHLLGLLSEASSHGTIQETLKIAELARQNGVESVYLHCILDGRSAAIQGADDLLAKYRDALRDVHVATVVGRGYALDRGKDYVGKTQKVYRALVDGEGIAV